MPTSGPRSARTFKSLSTRRDWALSEKRAIVAEMMMPGTNVSALARRYGVAQSQLYRWRKAFAPDATPTPPSPNFLPVVVATALPDHSARPPLPTAPRIEIVLTGGRVVRVDADVDTVTLARIVAALEAVP